jgi:predicted mannosyl-3-phosphoglycerate phosphatase (HAD superfamily)
LSRKGFAISNDNSTGTPAEKVTNSEEILSESFAISKAEQAEASFSLALSGVERARRALAEARERAEKQAEVYQAELKARIEADKRKRAEVLAELARLKAERGDELPDQPTDSPTINPESFNSEWDI